MNYLCSPFFTMWKHKS